MKAISYLKLNLRVAPLENYSSLSPPPLAARAPKIRSQRPFLYQDERNRFYDDFCIFRATDILKVYVLLSKITCMVVEKQEIKK